MYLVDRSATGSCQLKLKVFFSFPLLSHVIGIQRWKIAICTLWICIHAIDGPSWSVSFIRFNCPAYVWWLIIKRHTQNGNNNNKVTSKTKAKQRQQKSSRFTYWKKRQKKLRTHILQINDINTLCLNELLQCVRNCLIALCRWSFSIFSISLLFMCVCVSVCVMK